MPARKFSLMTADECNRRAADCAATAAAATDEAVSLEFLKLAAQWRAMAVRDIFLGALDEPSEPITQLNAPRKRPN